MMHTRMKLLRYTVLSASLLSMMLRTLLYATAIDQKGLLTAGHWAIWSILILTGLILGILLLVTRSIQNPAVSGPYSPRSIIRGAGSLIAAAAISVRSLSLYPMASDPLEQVAAVSGIIAGIGFLIVGIFCVLGKKPNFLCHSAISIFFALQLVSQYRNWSADPQLMDYCFYLAAIICLMFTAYFLAGFDADMGNHRGMVFFSLTAVFFCCLALPESGDAPMLISCALWAFTCTAQIQAKPKEEAAYDYS